MKIYVILVAFFLTSSCLKKESSNALSPGADSVEGIYTGYRSQQNGQKIAADSTKITLQVTRLAADQVEILQTSPNEFKYKVTMQDLRFTYDLGITEAGCGVAKIKGEGAFHANTLYLLETLECTRTITGAKTFTQLRATKQ
jgi:hypothetical protein